MKHYKQMRLDCRRYMAGAMAAAFLQRLTSAAAPMVSAWLIGDMANHLLALDTASVLAGLPGFACAVLIQVAGAALFDLALNLLLTRQGFAYDAFLMEKFICLPLEDIKTTSAGAVMERLEEDSAAFCWNQMVLLSYPTVILVCAGLFGSFLFRNDTPGLFALTIVLMAALPIFRAGLIGKARAELNCRISEYQGDRRQLEQELYDGAAFAGCYGLDGFFIGRLRDRFERYLKELGMKLCRLDAGSEILDYLCTYGVQIGTVIVGALLIGAGELSPGGLLSGYLMIPTVRSCCDYIQLWVKERPNEQKLLERLSFFYAGVPEKSDDAAVLRALTAENVTFSYPGDHAPVLKNRNFCMTDQENVRITGENGSGKTTLMSLLSGLCRPNGGTVCSGASLEQLRNSTACQQQNGAIFSGSVWENLFLPESKREQAQELLREMGFEKPLAYQVTSEGGNLSPGEQKKLLLVRALLRKAPFLLLDEPLNHLDSQGRRALRSVLEQRNGGILLICHQELPLERRPFRIYPM